MYNTGRWILEETNILEEYYALGGIYAVQKHGVNRSSSQIKSKAKDLGIQSTVPYINKELKDYIRDNRYDFSPSVLSNHLGLHVIQVESILHECTIKDKTVKTNKEKAILSQGLREGFFSQWTPEMAWVLGVLTADGNVYENKISLSLNERDTDVVEKVARLLGENLTVRYNSRNMANIGFSSDKMARDLKALGVVPNKSLVCETAKVPEAFINHYVRGLIDGDGSIMFKIPKPRENAIKLDFVGSFSLVELVNSTFERFSDKPIKISESWTNSGNVIYRTRIYNLKAVKYCKEFLYKNTHEGIRMNRKYVKFLEGCDYYLRKDT